MVKEAMPPSTNTPKRGGPAKSVASHIQRIVGPAAKKRGFAEAEILTRWTEIIGPDLGARSSPEKLRYAKGASMEATLVIRADGATALELQHLESQILERINTYYGYRAVAKLQYLQGYVGDALINATAAAKPKRELTEAEASALDAQLDGIESPSLRASLRKIGDAILRRKTP